MVDEYKNVDLVIKKLSNMGYQTELYAELDLDFFSSVEVVISITTIILSVISIICVYFFIKSTLQENYKNVALYKLLGYEDKIVSLIYLIQYITYTNIALIIGIVLSNIIKIIISSILTFNPNFSVLNIYIFYGPGMIYYLFIIIVIFISLFILFKIKYKKYSPIMLMEDRL